MYDTIADIILVQAISPNLMSVTTYIADKASKSIERKRDSGLGEGGECNP